MSYLSIDFYKLCNLITFTCLLDRGTRGVMPMHCGRRGGYIVDLSYMSICSFGLPAPILLPATQCTLQIWICVRTIYLASKLKDLQRFFGNKYFSYDLMLSKGIANCAMVWLPPPCCLRKCVYGSLSPRWTVLPWTIRQQWQSSFCFVR